MSAKKQYIPKGQIFDPALRKNWRGVARPSKDGEGWEFTASPPIKPGDATKVLAKLIGKSGGKETA